MDIRHHQAEGKTSQATYSDCGAYRYWLSRRWGDGGNLLNFVMLNPSVADEVKNDPTIERCERRAHALGFDGFIVTNIFAWRATDPRELRKATAPVGPENTRHVMQATREAAMTIAAWGVHGEHQTKGPETARMLWQAGFDLHHLGLSKKGHPRHPLYVPYARTPRLWSPE